MSEVQAAKAAVRAFWRDLDAAPLGGTEAVAVAHLSADFHWQGFAPLEDTRGTAAYAAGFLEPMRRAFPDYARQVHIFLAGRSDGARVTDPDWQEAGAIWVGATGYLTAVQAEEVFGIPASDRPLRLRWAEFYRVEAGQIVQCQHLIDLVDWFEQIGRPVLPKPTGVPHVWPAPTGYDGCLYGTYEAEAGAKSLALGRALIFDGLNSFDQSDLSSMGMAGFFHPNIKWYGPGGIGACLSLDEFTVLHQEPWLVAFPDRSAQDLDNLIGEDRIVAGSSLPGVLGHHRGTYQGVAGTGAAIAVNGIDFWLRDGDQFTENWVYVDFVHLFAQMGVDLIARMKAAG